MTLDISAQSELADIVAGRYDAGFRVGSRLAKDMISMRITDDVRFAVVAAPAYLARRGIPQGPADLHAHSCIRLRLSAGGFLLWTFIIKGKSHKHCMLCSRVPEKERNILLKAAY